MANFSCYYARNNITEGSAICQDLGTWSEQPACIGGNETQHLHLL